MIEPLRGTECNYGTLLKKAEDKVHLHLRKMRFKTSWTENWHTFKGPYMGKKNFNENNVQYL